MVSFPEMVFLANIMFTAWTCAYRIFRLQTNPELTSHDKFFFDKIIHQIQCPPAI